MYPTEETTFGLSRNEGRGDQPRPQGFSVKKWVGRPFFKGKALGTRLRGDKSFHFVSGQARKHRKTEDTGYEIAVSNNLSLRFRLRFQLLNLPVF